VNEEMYVTDGLKFHAPPDRITVMRVNQSVAWEGTIDEFADLLEVVRTREAIPWCATHDLPMMYDKDRCNRSPNPTHHGCRQELPVQHWVIR